MAEPTLFDLSSPVKKKTGPQPRPPADRFWEKVNKTDGCWFWTAAKLKSGYGVFGLRHSDKRMILAHRFSWFLETGQDVPVDMLVCHHCDNPTCVRPSHLFLGTPKDNMHDMINKGRDKYHKFTREDSLKITRRCGEGVNTAKLNPDKVRIIRQLLSEGISAAQISKQFNVRKGNIWFIATGRSWKHVI